MARGSDQATTAATTAQNLSGTYSGNASNIFGSLYPMLSSEAAHPTGMTPTDIANADTAAQQSAGGSQSAAVGQGALRAARTRNAGAGDAAIGESARTAGRNLSTAALSTRLRDASLKNENRRSALSGLGNLFSENLTGGNQALGQVAGDINANTNAENASWDWARDLFVPLVQSGQKAAMAGMGP